MNLKPLYKPLVKQGIKILDNKIEKCASNYARDICLLNAGEANYPCENLIGRATLNGVIAMELTDIRNKLSKLSREQR